MDLLSRDGIDCRSIDLPFTGYADDVECVRSAIAAASADAAVHVVCHSYGGLPVAEAGHAAAHLTFIAGRLPEAGESPAAPARSRASSAPTAPASPPPCG